MRIPLDLDEEVYPKNETPYVIGCLVPPKSHARELHSHPYVEEP